MRGNYLQLFSKIWKHVFAQKSHPFCHAFWVAFCLKNASKRPVINTPYNTL